MILTRTRSQMFLCPSRSRTTIITNQFHSPTTIPSSIYWHQSKEAGPYIARAFERNQAQKEDTDRTRETRTGRSVVFSKAASRTPPPHTDAIPQEELTKATTILNRIVARLALGGHSMDTKTNTEV